jgi:hypothetical protein
MTFGTSHGSIVYNLLLCTNNVFFSLVELSLPICADALSAYVFFKEGFPVFIECIQSVLHSPGNFS